MEQFPWGTIGTVLGIFKVIVLGLMFAIYWRLRGAWKDDDQTSETKVTDMIKEVETKVDNNKTSIENKLSDRVAALHGRVDAEKDATEKKIEDKAKENQERDDRLFDSITEMFNNIQDKIEEKIEKMGDKIDSNHQDINKAVTQTQIDIAELRVKANNRRSTDG